MSEARSSVLKLRGNRVSNYYNKVRLALLEKGVPFEEDAGIWPSQKEAWLARSFDPLQKSRIVFEAVIEAVVLRLEADQHPGRLAVASNDDFALCRLAQVPRQVVLDLRQRDFLHFSSDFACLASHVAASDFGTIESISTRCSVTS